MNLKAVFPNPSRVIQPAKKAIKHPNYFIRTHRETQTSGSSVSLALSAISDFSRKMKARPCCQRSLGGVPALSSGSSVSYLNSELHNEAMRYLMAAADGGKNREMS